MSVNKKILEEKSKEIYKFLLEKEYIDKNGKVTNRLKIELEEVE